MALAEFPVEDRRHWLPAAVRAAAVERTLTAGETLFRQGSRTVGLYEVVRGKVRLVRINRSGREVLLHSATDGETIAEASLFSPTYHCDAIASTKTVARLYPKAALLAEFKRDPKAMEAFAAKLGQQIMDLRTRLEQRNIHSARERILHHLTVNVGPDGRTVILPGTLKDLAADLGLTHEALYRTLAKMQANAEIQRRSGIIRLLKPSYDSDHT